MEEQEYEVGVVGTERGGDYKKSLHEMLMLSSQIRKV